MFDNSHGFKDFKEKLVDWVYHMMPLGIKYG
jgi:hypothetical protein